MANRKDVTISRELYEFLIGVGPMEGVWFGDLNDGLPGRFWWRALLRCAAGELGKKMPNAIAMETRRAIDSEAGVVAKP